MVQRRQMLSTIAASSSHATAAAAVPPHCHDCKHYYVCYLQDHRKDKSSIQNCSYWGYADHNVAGFIDNGSYMEEEKLSLKVVPEFAFESQSDH
ncbi:uncharacterized protein DS421_8g227320 [Arachis hypogaea]|nr:uncharacterized protein DS421_8g227320 [Arachis hypogaea]